MNDKATRELVIECYQEILKSTQRLSENIAVMISLWEEVPDKPTKELVSNITKAEQAIAESWSSFSNNLAKQQQRILILVAGSVNRGN